MSRREVIDCDRCGAKEVPDPAIIHVAVGSRPCPAGGRSEEDVRRVDLCPKCAAALLNDAVKSIDDYDQAAKWYKQATQGVKK